MCLFCSMRRRQVFRGLAAIAAGVATQSAASANEPVRRPGVMGFAVLAAASIAAPPTAKPRHPGAAPISLPGRRRLG